MSNSSTENPDSTTYESHHEAAESADTFPDKQMAMRVMIGSLGLLGNGFVIVVIFTFTSMRKKVTNTLIINQSVLDLIVSILLIGDAASKYISGYNVGFLKGLAAEVYCRVWVSSVLQWAMLMSSTYNLLAITIERYMMVVHPIRHKTAFSHQTARYILLAVWLVGPCYELLSGLPTAVVRSGVCVAFSHFPSPTWQKAYGFTTLALEFFIPLVVHPSLYAHMMVVMRRRASPAVAPPHPSAQPPSQKISRTQRNLLKTMAIVTIFFFLCWSWNEVGYFLYNLGFEYDPNGSFHLFTTTAVNINCCINPVIYISKYEEFRKAIRKLLLGVRVQPVKDSHTSEPNNRE